MKKLLPSILVLSMAATAGVAHAQDGYYLGANLGLNVPEDTDLEISTIDNEADWDNDFAGLLSLGHAYEGPLRGELEIGFRNQDADSVQGANATGGMDVISTMLNLYYDFDLSSSFKPYIGAGVGMVHADLNSVSPVAGSSIDDDDGSVAGQFIAGVNVPVYDNISLNGQYNFLAAPQLNFTTRSGSSVDAEYYTHTFTLGMRFHLNPPKPMVKEEPKVEEVAEVVEVAEPAPQPALEIKRNFIVFFDWDSAEITREARLVLQQAASYSKVGKIATIELTGHTDSSGTNNYNDRLAQRRSNAVEGVLRELGLSSQEIVKMAKGEGEQLVPTEDGVREPQNRRVEIMLK